MSRSSKWSGVFDSATAASGGADFVIRFDPSMLDRGNFRMVQHRLGDGIPLLERRG